MNISNPAKPVTLAEWLQLNPNPTPGTVLLCFGAFEHEFVWTGEANHELFHPFHGCHFSLWGHEDFTVIDEIGPHTEGQDYFQRNGLHRTSYRDYHVKCTCDFSGPNCWLGCRCGALKVVG